jgi:plastocyanin
VRKRYSGTLIGLALLLVFTIVIPAIPHVKAIGGLALDGSGFGSALSDSCSLTGTLSTVKNPDLIVALLVMNDTTTTATVSDTAMLTWKMRSSQTGPSEVQIFFYYAIAPESLSADVVTFALSKATGADCYALGVSGADINVPFDQNLAMPSKASGDSTSWSIGYTTNNPNDLLIILEGFCAQGTDVSGSPLGFTAGVGAANAEAHTTNCPANYLQGHTYYEIVSATQASTPVPWTFNTQSSPFAVIGDAIQSAPGPLSALVEVGSNAVDVGQQASFSCTGAGGVPPYTYSWAFGDGSTGSGASTTHIYNTPGTMNVACTVTDSLGTIANDAVQLMANPRVTLASITCAGPSITDHGSACDVTVIDNSPGAFITPTGIVGLGQTGVAGTFTACMLAGSGASATCISTFTASTPGTAAITASYPGDSTHKSSGGTESITVSSALSISSFTASLTSVDAGDKVTFTVTTSGGYGALSYSYANLPAGCLSTNSTTLSCSPTSAGNYRVTVIVSDRAMESANATTTITVGPQRILGLPQAMGLAVIFAAIVGTSTMLIMSVALALRRKKRRQAPATA